MKAKRKRRRRANRARIASDERSAGKRSGTKPAGDRPSESDYSRSGRRRRYRRPAAVLVCGTRTFDDLDYLESELRKLTRDYRVTHVLVGGSVDRDGVCRLYGADKLAHDWALRPGNCPIGVTVQVFYAERRKYRKAAGPRRNSEEVAALLATPPKVKACVAFWDGESSGTLDTIRKCKRKGIPVKIRRFE